ncbi:hypothetical protein STEG23_029761, partial [Scotinomys teguina]
MVSNQLRLIVKTWSMSLNLNQSHRDIFMVVVFSLSLSIPILDCHHTWCCCGTPSDFYCATQT